MNLTAANVTIASSIAGCPSSVSGAVAPGRYYKVTINGPLAVNLPPPLNQFATVTAMGCFPIK